MMAEINIGYFLQGEAASQGESGAGTPGHGETETEGPGAEAENGEDQGAGKHIRLLWTNKRSHE